MLRPSPFSSFSIKSSRGSLLLESLVLLALIAMITPVIYNYVSNRRIELDRINEANTLIAVQRSTGNYLKSQYASLIETIATNGKTVRKPSQINPEFGTVFDDRFLIGIKRTDSTEGVNFNALIINIKAQGSDLGAGKTAELVGVSAGIISAMQPTKALGQGGVWQENLSDFFDAAAIAKTKTGTAVATASYGKELTKNYLHEITPDTIDSDLNLGDFSLQGKKVTADEFCLNNPELEDFEKCIKDWDSFQIVSPWNVIETCTTELRDNATDSPSCKSGYELNINRSCEQIGRKAKLSGVYAPSACYTITTSKYNKHMEGCLFVNGKVASDVDTIEMCKDGYIVSMTGCSPCNKSFLRSCATILDAYKKAGKTPPSGIYNLFDTAGNKTQKACCFSGQSLASNEEIINTCRGSTGNKATFCRCGFEKSNITKNCASIKRAWFTAPSGYYTTTTSATSYTNDIPCYFYSTSVANACQAISTCSNNSTTNNDRAIACAFSYYNNYNRSCQIIKNNCPSLPSNYYNISSSLTSYASQPCYYVGNLVASHCQTISGCNSGTNIACAYGYYNSYNQDCSQVLGANCGYACDTSFKLTTSLTTSTTGICQACYVPPPSDDSDDSGDPPDQPDHEDNWQYEYDDNGEYQYNYY